MQVRQFLQSQNVRWMPIKLNGKKPCKTADYMPKMTDFYNYDKTGNPISDDELIRRQKYIEDYDYIAIDTTQVAQVDVDDIQYEELLDCPYYKSITKQLPHYFGILPNPEHYKNKTNWKDENDITIEKIDVLNGQWAFCQKDCLVYNVQDNIPQIPPNRVLKNDERKKTKRTTPPSSEKAESSTESKTDVNQNTDDDSDVKVDYKTLEKIVMGLNKKRAETYDNWTKVMWAIVNVGEFSEINEDAINTLIHKFSAQSKKYTPNVTESKINERDPSKTTLSIGTLLWMLKDDNKTLFNQVMKYFVYHDPKKPSYNIMKLYFENDTIKIDHPPMIITNINSQKPIHYTLPKAKECFVDYGSFFANTIDKKGNTQECWNEFYPKWIKDAKKRKYKHSECLPPPKKCDVDTYNTWNGFEIEILAKQHKLKVNTDFDNIPAVQKYIQLIYWDICRKDKKVFKYFMGYIAQMIQQPAIHVRKAICLKGEQGTGKGLQCGVLKRIIGEHHTHESDNPRRDYFGTFNTALRHKIMVNVNETSSKDTTIFADMLKGMVDCSEIPIRDLFMSVVTENNYMRMFFCTNNDFPLKVEMNDRRYVLLETSDEHIGKDHPEYWKDMFSYLGKDADLQNFYDIFNYLKQYDISEWDAEDRPMTEVYNETRKVCLSIVMKYIRHITIKAWINKKQPKKKLIGNSSEMINQIREWATENNYKESIIPNRDSLEMELKKYKNKEIYYENGWMLDPKLMKKYFVHNNLWDDYQFIDDDDDKPDIDENPDL